MAYTSHGYYIPGTSLDDPKPTHLFRCGGLGLCAKCANEAVLRIEQDVKNAPANNTMELEYHDENTLLKVYTAMGRAGLQYGQIMDAVNEMQNDGILFRERGMRDGG